MPEIGDHVFFINVNYKINRGTVINKNDEILKIGYDFKEGWLILLEQQTCISLEEALLMLSSNLEVELRRMASMRIAPYLEAENSYQRKKEKLEREKAQLERIIQCLWSTRLGRIPI